MTIKCKSANLNDESVIISDRIIVVDSPNIEIVDSYKSKSSHTEKYSTTSSKKETTIPINFEQEKRKANNRLINEL